MEVKCDLNLVISKIEKELNKKLNKKEKKKIKKYFENSIYSIVDAFMTQVNEIFYLHKCKTFDNFIKQLED